MDETQIDSAPFLRPRIYEGYNGTVYARIYCSVPIGDNNEPSTEYSVCSLGAAE